MDLVRRVLTNVVNTILPDSFREPSVAARKRGPGSYEPELTDDEEVPDSFFSSSKRMRPSIDPGPSTSINTAVMFEKPFGADVTRGKVVPIQLTCENVRAVGKSTDDDVIAVRGSSMASNSRQSALDSSVSYFQRKWFVKKDPLRKIHGTNSITKKYRKDTLPVFETFKRNFMNYCPKSKLCTTADVIRLQERSEYMKMVDSCMQSNLMEKSSKPSTSVDSGRSSQNGIKPLSLMKSKVSEPELINSTMNWFNGSNAASFGPMASTPLSVYKALNSSNYISPFPAEVRSPNKVIDTIDLSRESDSDDSVICESETPISTPKPTFTPKSSLKKSASAKNIESLGERIKRVLDTSLGDIEKSDMVANGDDEKESSVNSSEKENDDEVEFITPSLKKHPPINTFELSLRSSPYVRESWSKNQKSSFNESKRERDEKIKHFETTLQILKDESTLDRDLAQIVRRNLTLTDIIVLEKPEEELKLPEITDEMLDVIIRARSSGRGLSEVITTTANNIQITKSDIKSLAPMQWLNDNVINSYLDLVALRSKSQNNWPSVYVFTTFFYPKYLNEGYSNILKRWTRKVDLFSYDLLIFPIHLGIHWCLAAADRRKKIIKYYDSLGGKNYQCPKALLQYLGKEHQERKKSSLDDNWRAEIVEDIPQQQNGSDCGMFACKFAEYLSRDAELNFKQEDMNYYRERMIYEIITGDLLYP